MDKARAPGRMNGVGCVGRLRPQASLLHRGVERSGTWHQLRVVLSARNMDAMRMLARMAHPPMTAVTSARSIP